MSSQDSDHLFSLSPYNEKCGTHSWGLTPSSLRRSSFLSQNMTQNESFSVYDSYTFTRGPASYHIISLKESQGFLFNQDLFASTYQQLRTLLREKHMRELASKKRSKSHSSTLRWPASVSRPHQKQPRRHTTYGLGPMLRMVGDDLAVDEGSSDEMCIDDFAPGSERGPEIPPSTLPKAMSFSEPRGYGNGNGYGHGTKNGNINLSGGMENLHEDLDATESDEAETLGFTPIGSNYVPVIDILVDDMDHVPDI